MSRDDHLERAKVTINEMRARFFSEARRLGFGKATLWRHWLPKIDIIAKYYRDNEVLLYDPVVTGEFLQVSQNPLPRW